MGAKGVRGTGAQARQGAGLAGDALAAYLYGYPLVLMAVTRRNMLTAGLRGNELFLADAFPRPEERIAVRPGVDLLACTAWLDLTASPLVLRLPAVAGRFCQVELLDAWSNVFASLGTRTTGDGPRDFLVAGPGGAGQGTKLPRIDCPTSRVLLRGGVVVNGAGECGGDLAAAEEALRGFGLAPLAFYEKYGSFEPGSTLPRARLARRPASLRLAEGTDAEGYFTLMAAEMAANPPAADAEMEQKLAALGLQRSPFLFSELPEPVRRALAGAVRSGPGAIVRAARDAYAGVMQGGGWLMPLQGMGTYGDWYLQRAVAARFLPGAPIPQDTLCGFCAADAQGAALHGGCAYRLRFPAGQFPPARAFWSLTLYGPEGYLTRCAVNRPAVGPRRSRLAYNVDGSLDLFIGRRPSGRGQLLNWLPAPRGTFNLLLRVYMPDSAALAGAWRPPAVELVEGEAGRDC